MMALLEALPPELRLQIYELVFYNLHVIPNPILYTKHPSCERFEKAKFEEMQAAAPGPHSLFMTSKFFYQDPFLRQAFYANATFGFVTTWHWAAFKHRLRHSPDGSLRLLRSITTVKDMAPEFGRYHLDLDQITPGLLPNLRHIHLTLFGGFPDIDSRTIQRIHIYREDEEIDCDACSPPVLPYQSHYLKRLYCIDHSCANPMTFASRPSVSRVEREFRKQYVGSFVSDSFHPSAYIMINFFNDFRPELESGPRGFTDWTFECKQGWELKKRMIRGDLDIHLSWVILFNCGLPYRRYIPVVRNHSVSWTLADLTQKAHFSSTDWMLRYEWMGNKYAIPQDKPTRYDKKTGKFICSSGQRVNG